MPWGPWVALDFTTIFMFLIFWQMFGSRLRRRFLLRYNPAAVAVINIEGVIKYESSEQSHFRFIWNAMAEVLVTRPKALIMRINTPGGTVGASQELYSMANRIRANGTKVVALFEDVAASGGLYVGMASDRIVAQPGTVTGSIGVINQTMDYSAVLRRFQIGVRTVKSGPHKDIMSPYREMTDADERILHDMVWDVYNQFCEAVSNSRNIPYEKVQEFADGRIFSGKKAFELGLVDEVGSFMGAVKAVCGLAGINPARAVLLPYKFRKGLFGGGMGMHLKRFENLLPDADLKGIPLWLMPR